jgi:hypothetical protein
MLNLQPMSQEEAVYTLQEWGETIFVRTESGWDYKVSVDDRMVSVHSVEYPEHPEENLTFSHLPELLDKFFFDLDAATKWLHQNHYGKVTQYFDWGFPNNCFH